MFAQKYIDRFAKKIKCDLNDRQNASVRSLCGIVNWTQIQSAYSHVNCIHDVWTEIILAFYAFDVVFAFAFALSENSTASKWIHNCFIFSYAKMHEIFNELGFGCVSAINRSCIVKYVIRFLSFLCNQTKRKIGTETAIDYSIKVHAQVEVSK